MSGTPNIDNLIQTDVTWRPSYVDVVTHQWERTETVRNIYLSEVRAGKSAGEAVETIRRALGIKRTIIYHHLNRYRDEVLKHEAAA